MVKDCKEVQTISLKKKPELETDLSTKDIMDEFYSLNARFDNVQKEIFKLVGKIELEEESRAALTDKISEMVSQNGELRSIVVRREKFLDKIEEDFFHLKQEIAIISPQELQSKFDKITDKVVKLESTNDRTDNIINNIKEDLSHMNKRMSKIKSFDNIMDVLDEIKKINTSNEQLNAKIERNTAKTETMFTDMGNKTSELESHEDRIKALEKTIESLNQKLDNKVINKIENFVLREDFKKVEENVKIIKSDIFKNQFVKAVKLSDTKSKKDLKPKELTSQKANNPKELSIEANTSNTNNSSTQTELNIAKTTKKQDDSIKLTPKMKALFDYLNNIRLKGFSLDKARNELIKKGWSAKDIDSCISNLSS
jgi:chromosome segregation ATPase